MLQSITRIGKSAVLAALGLALLGGASAQAQQINGAGATFPAPLYLKWFQEYKDATGAQVNYQAIGSGGGIKNITAHAVDFGASDAPMNAAELSAAPGILHIPTVAGAVVVAYNIPGVGPGIHLTPGVIADIFLGKITKWNDPQITRLSPGTNFPSTAIFPAPSLGWFGNDEYLHDLPERCQLRMERQRRRGQIRSLAQWPRWQGQRGCRAAYQTERGRHRVY